MKKCKYCGKDIFQEKDLDGTYDESYCNKIHRKDHERQLIKDGMMSGIEDSGFSVMKDTQYRDGNGELIHFPGDGRPYFDMALQRTFHSKKEKCEYMKKNGLVMDGSSDKRNLQRIPEAGDTRFRRVR